MCLSACVCVCARTCGFYLLLWTILVFHNDFAGQLCWESGSASRWHRSGLFFVGVFDKFSGLPHLWLMLAGVAAHMHTLTQTHWHLCIFSILSWGLQGSGITGWMLTKVAAVCSPTPSWNHRLMWQGGIRADASSPRPELHHRRTGQRGAEIKRIWKDARYVGVTDDELSRSHWDETRWHGRGEGISEIKTFSYCSLE